MQFSFNVGVNEKHRVDFSFDQFMGNVDILVDGQSAIKDFRMFSLSLTKRYEFTVGVAEQHAVVIENEDAVAGCQRGPVHRHTRLRSS